MADTLEVEGLRIAYERAGTGPPVALGHGFVGDGRSTWSSQIEFLSPVRRVEAAGPGPDTDGVVAT